MIDKLTLKLDNRALKAVENLYSGETITVELTDSGLSGLTADNHRFVIFGTDRSVLAVSEAFTADGCTWTATINTATEAFQTYYANVSGNASKALGMMIIDNTTGDVLCAGSVSVICVPFPAELVTVPVLYADGFIRRVDMETYCSSRLGEVEAVLDAILGQGA